MANVEVVRELDVTADSLWGLVSDFGNCTWMAGAEATVEGCGPGMVRIINNTIREKLDTIDPLSMAITYSIGDDCIPFPVTGYRARMKVDDLGDSRSRLTWSCTMEPSGVSEIEAVGVLEATYDMMIGWIADSLKSAPVSESQRAEHFETPERSKIVPIMQEHVAAMESSNDESVWIGAGMRYLLLRTIGRRSGAERKVALPLWLDADGSPILVASYAGAPNHPAWYTNLADRKANPEVLCRIRERGFWAQARILDGDEYVSVWEALTADRPFYRDYQALTERRIPLVRLRETRPVQQ